MLKLKAEPLMGRSGHDAGRQLLMQMYQQETGRPMPQIAVLPKGKPYFPGDRLHFSISHTRYHVFCALSDRPVGIDAEERDRPVKLRLAKKILSDHEYRRFLQHPDPHDALLRLWVLKEAAAKLSGEGLHGYPNHTDFSPDDPRIQILQGCLVATIQQEEPYAF